MGARPVAGRGARERGDPGEGGPGHGRPARGARLPTKALSDASYDLACGLARAGRSDDAMRYLPDAFSYNDKAAVPVLKAWARTDRDLSPLTGRPDFRTLVGA